MSQSMIEQVAKILHPGIWETEKYHCTCPNCLKYRETQREAAVEQAKLIIYSMREIPQSMYDNYKCEKPWKELNSKEV